MEPYRIQEKARWSWPPLIGYYTTPFLRVALAANTAKKHYKPFTEADVTAEMLAPEIQVYASSQPVQGTVIANVETIVLMPKKSKDRSQGIQPTRMTWPFHVIVVSYLYYRGPWTNVIFTGGWIGLAAVGFCRMGVRLYRDRTPEHLNEQIFAVTYLLFFSATTHLSGAGGIFLAS